MDLMRRHIVRARTAVLMYHDVVDASTPNESGFSGAAPATYKVDAALFGAHLTAIARSVTRNVRIERDAFEVPNGGVLLTFDDGGVSAATRIAPMLEAHKWHGLFFVTTDRIGTPGFVSEDQVRALWARGHVVGSHTRSHPIRLSSEPRASIDAEWRESVGVLSEIVGDRVITASVPNGAFDNEVVQAAVDAGIRWLFTSDPTRVWWTCGECHVVGRYSVRSGTSADWVAAVATGAVLPRYVQWLQWQAKGVAKRIAGVPYRRARERWSGRHKR